MHDDLASVPHIAVITHTTGWWLRITSLQLCAAATYASSRAAPAPAPGSDRSDEYGLTPGAPSARVQHG